MSLSEDAGLELMRQLRLTGQLQHAWVTHAWQTRDAGLHPAAAILLSDLAANGECRPSDLAKRKMVDVSVVSRQISQLSAAGLIERRPAPEDGRAALVRVSEQGLAEIKKWRENHIEFFRKALEGWDEAEVAELTGRIAEMNEALRTAMDRLSRGDSS
ncbi:MarR family winged helix-turn-helix transcriptional regulator [Amycolatopsis cynarae]|uniref:MarR family winged helix-turn-helix transcriptional regulator n=1 Tax=Amycolatopsis cynarae TaxID=2995223 RepID=A0ABY7B4T8_9PSEU|nr:MarR family winged helix-turn-helix transcriptional regulator [Amycolatopsis sp. HUAS 11-8]WAL65813.1 MarR family winged helix-turn-helix transcriptional regulator [Amycolatopsis sp. HUAS 11-8]